MPEKNPVQKQEEFENKSLTLLETAMKIKVVDEKTYLEAAEFCKKIKDEKKTREEFFKPLKAATHAAHKALCNKETASISPLDEADAHVRNKVIKPYLDEQDRLREIEQKKEAEKSKLAADAERKKLLARAESAKKETTKERLEEAAEEIYQEPVIVEHTVKKTASFSGGGGITRKKDIKIVITDPIAFLKAVADGIIPVTCIEIKEGNIKRWVKAAGKEDEKIPGIRIEKVSGLSIR